MRGKQFQRNQRILLMLMNHQYGLSVDELAEAVGCTTRTIFRDLDALHESGYPVTTVKTAEGTKYVFTEGSQVKVKLAFSRMELIALRIASMTSYSLLGTALYDALESARQKVEVTMCDEHLEYANALQSMFEVSFKPIRNYEKFNKTIQAIIKSLLSNTRLKINYWTPSKGTISEREIEPYRFWFVNNALYIIGYCHNRKEVRTFLVDRIRSWELTDKKYEIPKDFKLEEHTSSGFKVLGGTKDYEVVVRVHPILKPIITEQTWHPSQQVEEIEDGWFRVRFRLGALDEIKVWIQGYSPYVIVEKPDELIDDIIKAFTKSLEVYGK